MLIDDGWWIELMVMMIMMECTHKTEYFLFSSIIMIIKLSINLFVLHDIYICILYIKMWICYIYRMICMIYKIAISYSYLCNNKIYIVTIKFQWYQVKLCYDVLYRVLPSSYHYHHYHCHLYYHHNNLNYYFTMIIISYLLLLSLLLINVIHQSIWLNFYHWCVLYKQWWNGCSSVWIICYG